MTISVIDAAGNTQTVQTINDLVAGGMVVTIGSSIVSTVAVSGGTITPSSVVSVAPSSAITVTQSSAVTVTQSGTVTIAGAVNVTAGTITPSSAVTVTPSSSPTVILSSNPTVILSSNPTVILSSNPTVILSSNPTVILSSNPTVIPSSVVGVQLQTATTGGVSVNHYITVASTLNATVVKNAAGTLYGMSAQNTGTAVAYVKVYNKATAPTSQDTPALTYLVPFSSTAGFSTPTVNPLVPPMGAAFGTGLSFWTTANSSDSDNTVAVPVLVLNFYWA